MKIPKNPIRNSNSKDRQYNGQKTKDKRTNNDLQIIRHKNRVTLIPLKPGGELRCSGRVISSCALNLISTKFSKTNCVNTEVKKIINAMNPSSVRQNVFTFI